MYAGAAWKGESTMGNRDMGAREVRRWRERGKRDIKDGGYTSWV